MKNSPLRNHYDVIIIGAGVSGLQCARMLSESDLSVLIVDANKNPEKKVCAGGVLPHDKEYIPDEFFNHSYRNLHLHYRGRTMISPEESGVVATIDREGFIRSEMDYIKKTRNIELITGVRIKNIINNSSLMMGENIISFNYLVGADGSNSAVRKFLKIPSEKTELAMHYTVEKVFDNIELFLYDKEFGTGFVWIFPHKDKTSIGCGSDISVIDAKTLKNNLDKWLIERNIDIGDSILQASVINYDYRGYRFGNIFLTGDAAGLTSGITGKGIYSAFSSGRQVAFDILGINNEINLIDEWVKKKKHRELIMPLLKKRFLRTILYKVAIRALSVKRAQYRLIRNL